LNRISLFVTAGTILAVLFLPLQLDATGLYTDFASYFTPVDTSQIAIGLGQTELQMGTESSMILWAELSWRFRERALVRLQLPYTTVEADMQYSYDIGDGFVSTFYRILGDTLNTSGIYLRADARLPMGAKAHLPISYGQLDGGAGFEMRRKTSFFQLRFASTFTLAGERIKTGPYISDNYLTLAGSMEMELVGGASLAFSAVGLFYRGGDAREIYVVSIQKYVLGGLGFALSGALEAGSSEARIFDSQLGLSLRYSMPAPAGDEK
jgi:hypothetical protein